ncbi:MAG: hypothetical protein ACI9OJ_001265 [Myxococcota bacterium]
MILLAENQVQSRGRFVGPFSYSNRPGALALLAAVVLLLVGCPDDLPDETSTGGIQADVDYSINPDAYSTGSDSVSTTGKDAESTIGADSATDVGSCVPSCGAHVCGGDGCGGSCGDCSGALVCAASGYCTNAGCEPDCAGKVCGGDGCGGQCGKCAVGEVCTPNNTCDGGAPGCGAVPAVGQCDGNTLKWCENGNIFSSTCDPAANLTCAWDANAGAYACVTGTCVPDCVAKACGSDGCGGQCGVCPQGESCTPNQVCEANCTAVCTGKLCGTNGCGGSCGTCPTGQVCAVDGSCIGGNCIPECAGKSCGADGCGGKCGVCPTGESCSTSATCEPGGCTADCSGKQCGADGCGGSCGGCPDGESCGAGFQCQGGGCTADCSQKACGDDGCGEFCGVCAVGSSCTSAGSCQVGGCIPECTAKQCGADGCGGSCGICSGGLSCDSNGACADPTGCVPACAGLDCGDDGCGGSCGSCASGSICDGGLCVDDVIPCGDIDYEGVCEGDTLSYCAGGLQVVDCLATGLTCGFSPDFNWFACVEPGTCVADCAGKEAGAADGCGSTCSGSDTCGDIDDAGTCDGTVLLYCSQGALITSDCADTDKVCAFIDNLNWFDCAESDSCVPTCDGLTCGADGCGGSCGACFAGETCNAGACESEGCGDVDSVGQCDGPVLTYCAAGSLSITDCSMQGQICDYNATFDWYGCLDEACEVDCAGKFDGESDGCGGTCAVAGCGDITTDGECEGTTLSYCVGDSIITQECADLGQLCELVEASGWYDCVLPVCTPDCTGTVCGSDGCGGSCGECTGATTCDPFGQCISDGCGDVTLAGQCADDILLYCAGDEVSTVDCASLGKLCTFNPTQEWFDCQDPICISACDGVSCGDDGCGGSCGACGNDETCDGGQCILTDPCGGITLDGECSGTTLTYCLGDELKVLECADSGQVCGFDADAGWYECMEPPEVSACGDVTFEGACNGAVLSWCENDSLETIDCAAAAGTCEYDFDNGFYDCEYEGN